MTTGAMCAGARVVACPGPGGGTRLEEVRSCPPLGLRPAAGSLWMVGTAAGPLPGDRVVLRIEVEAGASVTLRSTAATLALGDHGDAVSELRVDAVVGAGGELRWLPEPTIAAAGCHHRSVGSVRLAVGARLVWREELVLGRHREGPGRLASRVDIEAEAVPLLRHELRVGPAASGWQGPAVAGGDKALGVVVVVGAGGGRTGRRSPAAGRDPEVAVMGLAGGGTLVSARAPDAPALRRRLEAGVAQIPTASG